MDEWMDGWMDGWVNGLKDGCVIWKNNKVISSCHVCGSSNNTYKTSVNIMYLYTYISTYIHTYKHTYIHTYIYIQSSAQGI